MVQVGNNVPHANKRLCFVFGQVVRNARNAGVHLSAAQRLAVDNFVDRCLDNLRPTEVDAGLTAHHHDFVGQRRNVGSARCATAKYRSDLRNTGGRHLALTVKGVAKVVLIGKNAILLR